MIDNAREILNKYWGYDTFRPLQEDIIHSILKGHDTIALLPTGGGKSLCYQLPALLREGITIVISPLIALMKDQVLSLQEKEIKALAIPSGIPYNELDTLLDNCIYGHYKLLYLSPERLRQELVQERIKQMNVSTVAVDEAHCISHWGHDFRPAYLEIARLREIKPEIPILALTATATDQVLKDIALHLHLEDECILQGSYNRPNLTYTIVETSDKKSQLFQELKETTGSAILYVRNRKATVQISQFLKTRGITATSYHGGMSKDERQKNYTSWKDNTAKVMVATSAFGMGIDKSDVDRVIHLEIPDSIENYFQEAGRAGRNGQEAKAILIYNENDLVRLENQFLKVIPTIESVKQTFKKLTSYFQIPYGEGSQETFRFDFSDFCTTYSLHTITTFNTLLALERASIIALSQEFSKKATVLFKVKDVALSYYLIKNPQVSEVVKTILRTYGGVYEQITAINYAAISKKSGKTLEKIHEVLLTLDMDDIIDYDHKSFDTAVTFLVPREDDRTINPIAPYIKEQHAIKKNQIDAVKHFIQTSTDCRNVFLLNYFGESLKTPCNKCDICISKENHKLEDDLDLILLEFFKEERTASEIKGLSYPREKVVKTIRTLLEQKKIVVTPQNTYTLK